MNGTMSYSEIMQTYEISSRGTLYKWGKQYREYGTVLDNRGKFSDGKGNFTKKKKLIPEQMTKEELIEYVKSTEDIKKLMVYLKQQKKNIK